MSENLAVIPARGGSKGVPGKNLKLLAGKPLIYWSIKSALDAKCIDRVIVTTDSIEIARIAKNMGAEVPFMRPDFLSDDKATTEAAILHCIEWLKANDNYIPQNIFLLQPTSPVRKPGVIDRAYNHYITSNAQSLVSVSEFGHFLWEGELSLNALYDYTKRPRRQDIEAKNLKYRENGSIYITNINTLIDLKNRLGGRICSFLMSEEEGFEIDSFLDFSIVNTIMELVIKDQK